MEFNFWLICGRDRIRIYLNVLLIDSGTLLFIRYTFGNFFKFNVFLAFLSHPVAAKMFLGEIFA